MASTAVSAARRTRVNDGLANGLDDHCGGGDTRWQLFVTAHATAQALHVTMDIDLSITLGSTEENPDARTRTTPSSAGAGHMIHRNLALQALFTDVEPGERRVRLLARKSDSPSASQLTRGRMTLMVMGYDCV